MFERRNQTPQLDRIETRLYFDPKSMREHHPKLSAPPRARCLPRAPGHRIILNNFDGNYLLLGLRLRNALAPCIQRKHVNPCASQNSLRRRPLCSNSETRRPASARLNLRFTATTPLAFIPLLQHRESQTERMWLPERVRSAILMPAREQPFHSSRCPNFRSRLNGSLLELQFLSKQLVQKTPGTPRSLY